MSAENRLGPQECNFGLSQIEIVQALNVGIEQIRELSRRQVDTWRRIPFWALLTDGRAGPNSDRRRAYAEGLWALHGESYHIASVDLASGEIVRPGNPYELADEAQILSIFPDKLYQLDAEKTLNRLVNECREPVRSYAGTPESIAGWHRKMMEKYGITECYTRTAQSDDAEIRRQEDAALAADLMHD